MTVPATNEIYIARQPILNVAGALYAYELLFRSAGAKNAAELPDATAATAQVMKNSATVGMEKLVGKHRAFLNCNREILLGDLLALFDPQVFVLEILEDVAIDEPILAALKKLKAQGFTLALDDFVYNETEIERAKLALPVIDLIKIDLMLSAREDWGRAAAFIKANGKIALAEKVETVEDFQQCQAAGYDLFQGYFFAKPELLTSDDQFDANAISVIRVLHLLRTNPEISAVQREFKQAPDLAFALLKFINSAAFALRNPINSLAQAITMFGMNNLKRWLLLLLYARQSGGDTSQAGNSPLFENVAQRAALMESIAQAIFSGNRVWHEKAFLCGIISRMNALFRIPLEKIVEKFQLDDEISAGLLRGEGKLGQMLALVDALETSDTPKIESLTLALSITGAQLTACVNKSYIAAISM